jgi:hypothetical protein
MARREVIEINCDRCKRTETQPISAQPASNSPELEITFQGQKIVYSDLCKRCRDAVTGYFKQMTMQMSPKEEPANPAAPVAEQPKKGLFAR